MRSEGSKRLAALDMTQREIAARVGVSQQTVGMWQSGQRVPGETNRTALFRAFGIPVHAWPDDWILIRDTIIRKLADKAPELLIEIVDELEKLGSR